jgi:hypothetical protein
MMKEKNGSTAKVYWLIDAQLVIWNEMFFKRRQPQHFMCNKSYVQWTNEQSKVLGDMVWTHPKSYPQGFEHEVANNFVL